MKQKRTAPQCSTGVLALIGGSEDRRGEMAVLRRVATPGDPPTVTVIPTASDYPRERADEYRRAFSALGVPEVLVADVRSRADAAQPEAVAKVRRAGVVFFTGGDQVRLIQTLQGTPLLAEVWASFRRGATVAGTSAGAAAAGEVTIWSGDGAGFNQGAVRHCPGFGFIGGVTVDTHFDTRGRLARLAQYLCSGASRRGLGLAEDTAVIVHPGGLAEVVGSGMVTTLDAWNVEHSNAHTAAPGELLTITGLELGFVAPGTLFDLRLWRVVALPEPGVDADVLIGRERNELHDGLRAE
jgi:cyanophycinase